MRIVKLIRQAKKEGIAGQPGKLYIKGGYLFCHTVELDWKNNKINISCIPAGLYVCKMGIHHGTKEYPVYELQNVPNRSNIEIHIGNFLEDTKGCILVGEELKIYENKYWVKSSTIAFHRFMNRMNGEDFLLEIK